MTSPSISFNQNDLVEIVNGFNLWLKSKSYSSSTIRNYLSDINRYFGFINKTLLSYGHPPLMKGGNFSNSAAPLHQGELPDEYRGEGFKVETVSAYLATIKSDSNYSRYLSSLSKFFQYALDQNLIKVDPLKQAQKVKKPSTDDVLSDYQTFLTKKHFSISTIRNYLNDLRQFIDWSTNSEPR